MLRHMRLRPCRKCTSIAGVFHDEFFDAFYCKDCDIWLEGACPDPECCYCKGRPEVPSARPGVHVHGSQHPEP
jgi:hypothetical protein